MPHGKNGAGALGRALIKDRRRNKAESARGYHPSTSAATLAAANPSDRSVLPRAAETVAKNTSSVTHTSDLGELLQAAELANRQFESVKQSAVIISRTAQVVREQPARVDSEGARERATAATEEIRRIPRRPQWRPGITTAEDLDLAERAAFLEWRRALAEVEERDNSGLVLTPFEKNLEIWRQLWRVVERSDALVQVVDARDPLFYFCEDLGRVAEETPAPRGGARDAKRPMLVLLNKADLLTPRQRGMWAHYFQQKGVKFVFFSALEEAKKARETSAASATTSTSPAAQAAKEEEPKESRMVSAEELLQIFEGLAGPSLVVGDDGRGEGAKEKTRAATVGMIGYPNVGKSSTINALCGSKRVAVTSTPGKTKHFQTIPMTPRLTLCDCPGLVIPTFIGSKSEMVCNGVLSIDQATDWLSPVELICSRVPSDVLSKCYWGVQYTTEKQAREAAVQAVDPMPEDTVVQTTEALRFLGAIAKLRGFMRAANGEPDESRAARLVLKDYVSGKLFFGLPPPGIDREEFQSWIGAKEYRADDEGSAESAAKTETEEQKKPATSKAGAAGKSKKAKKGRKANGDEYSGTVHTAGRLGTDDYTRTIWTHHSPVKVAKSSAKVRQ